MEPLIQRYREGDPRAAQELLDRFQPYLLKWTRLLTAGCWDGRDPEIRHFLTLCGGGQRSPSAQYLCRRLRLYDREDLLQEIRVIFLESALRPGSLIARYRYALGRRVQCLLKDPLVSQTDRIRELEEHHRVGRDVPELDQSWIDGLTCGPGFDALQPRDRLIILHTKWYGHSIDETAALLGVSSATVDRSVRKAKGLLRLAGVG